LEQRGLATAVGADQADAVAAQDGRGEVAHHRRPARVRGRHPARLEHLPAGSLPAGGLHAHVTGVLATAGALHAHRLQPPHPPLVAGAPRLDALADPRLLLRQQLVEAARFLRFRIEPLLAAAHVVVPVAGPARELAAVDLDDAVGDRAQEAAVVGDEYQRARPRLEEALEPF